MIVDLGDLIPAVNLRLRLVGSVVDGREVDGLQALQQRRSPFDSGLVVRVLGDVVRVREVMELRLGGGMFEFVEREVDGPDSVEERGGSGDSGRVVGWSELRVVWGSEAGHEEDGSDGEVEQEEERGGCEPARHERSPHRNHHGWPVKKLLLFLTFRGLFVSVLQIEKE